MLIGTVSALVMKDNAIFTDCCISRTLRMVYSHRYTWKVSKHFVWNIYISSTICTFLLLLCRLLVDPWFEANSVISKSKCHALHPSCHPTAHVRTWKQNLTQRPGNVGMWLDSRILRIYHRNRIECHAISGTAEVVPKICMLLVLSFRFLYTQLICIFAR